jgi:hypothetical protein
MGASAGQRQADPALKLHQRLDLLEGGRVGEHRGNPPPLHLERVESGEAANHPQTATGDDHHVGAVPHQAPADLADALAHGRWILEPLGQRLCEGRGVPADAVPDESLRQAVPLDLGPGVGNLPGRVGHDGPGCAAEADAMAPTP